MTVLSLDYETRGRLDLRKVGLDRYTADPSFQVLMAAYRIDQGPLQHWEVHERPIPAELWDALLDPHVHKWAFNAAFERIVTRRGLGLDTPYEGWRCGMVLAYMRSFTGGLADVGEQLGAGEQKDKIGKQLISLFCQPQRITKTNKHEWRDWNTDPDRWDQFCEYNKQDVVAEEAIRDRLAPFPTLEDEWAFYCLDQIINDRGMPVDLEFVRNVKAMSDRRRDELLQEMETITGLENANSVSQLLPWLQARGYPYDDVRRESVAKALNRVDELWGGTEAPIVSVLQRRLWAARTSTKKADAALLTVGEGNRIRHMYQFAGASRTSRFSGKGVQPQNLARTPKVFEDTSALDCATNLIRRGEYDSCGLYVDEPMMMFSGCMRGMFRTEDEFHVCDYSSIESVGLAWIARCERMLDVFRAKRDIYKDFGSQIYKKPYEEITSSERQVSKSGILGCGFRLGAGKVVDGKKTGLLGYAESMGVELSQDEAEKVVKTFRDTYAEVKQFWYDCEAAVQYVIKKRRPFDVGYLRFDLRSPYLVIRLPSDRHLYYYLPRLERRIVATDRIRRVYEKGHFVGEEIETYERVVTTYMGRNQKKNKWERLEAHGGILTENIVQSLCRDILKVGMQRVHADGFNIVGHAHDEIITISRKGDNYYNWRRMRDLMTEPIEWAPGFPLGAAGWNGEYYRK